MELTISTTLDQLRSMIQEEVSKILASDQKPIEKAWPQKLSIDKAKVFLEEMGYKTSVPSLYRYVYADEIPFEKFGVRIIFDADKLTEWAQSRNRPNQVNKNESIQAVINSARNKSSRHK